MTRIHADQELLWDIRPSNAEGLKHCEITEKIIGIFYDVYNELGMAFLKVFTSKPSHLLFAKPG
jgi:hypothetical protein